MVASYPLRTKGVRGSTICSEWLIFEGPRLYEGCRLVPLGHPLFFRHNGLYLPHNNSLNSSFPAHPPGRTSAVKSEFKGYSAWQFLPRTVSTRKATATPKSQCYRMAPNTTVIYMAGFLLRRATHFAHDGLSDFRGRFDLDSLPTESLTTALILRQSFAYSFNPS